jgi:hypothetical protein
LIVLAVPKLAARIGEGLARDEGLVISEDPTTVAGPQVP